MPPTPTRIKLKSEQKLSETQSFTNTSRILRKVQNEYLKTSIKKLEADTGSAKNNEHPNEKFSMYLKKNERPSKKSKEQALIVKRLSEGLSSRFNLAQKDG